MKASEIILTTMLVISAFLVADTITDHLAIEGLFRRWAVNAALQTQFYAVIYLFFDYRDTSRQLSGKDDRSSDTGDAGSETDGIPG